MSGIKLNSHQVQADLRRDLERAQEARKKLFAAIIHHVRYREAVGRANGVMKQIRRDEKLCKLLVEYEDRSEVIGMMELMFGLDIEGLHRC
jgi:hypothetical protein